MKTNGAGWAIESKAANALRPSRSHGPKTNFENPLPVFKLMKTSRLSLGSVSLMTVTVLAAVLFYWKASTPPATISLAETSSASVSEKSSSDEVPAPKAPTVMAPTVSTSTPATVAATHPSETALPPGVAPELATDSELAYQLGQDISKLSAEALARLRADWKAHLAQTQSEESAVQ